MSEDRPNHFCNHIGSCYTHYQRVHKRKLKKGEVVLIANSYIVFHSRHNMSSSTQSYTCQDCGTSFGTREELREHNIKSHNEQNAQTARQNTENTQSSNQ
jgi:hypothetical protein